MNVERLIRRLGLLKEFAGGDCPPVRSRPYSAGPFIYFAHLNLNPIVGGAAYNNLVALPGLFDTFMLASVDQNHLTDNIWFSLNIINRQNPGSAGFVVDGKEEWFPFSANGKLNTGPAYWTVLRFSTPVDHFYIHSESNAGALPNMTIACSRDNGINVFGGAYS